MDDRELLQLLEIGQEGRNLEYKSSTLWDVPTIKAKITKSILGFSNVRDGGHIVIGVRELGDGSYDRSGVEAEHYDTYTYDNLTSHVSIYADPYVNFELVKKPLDDKNFIIIKVHEFTEIPVICKRDFNIGSTLYLKRGAIYTRSYRTPETVEVPSQTEMREILEMATEKKLRRLIESQSRVGISHQFTVTDEEKFDSELRDIASDE
jgi:predicted HTH transcriptional regulator